MERLIAGSGCSFFKATNWRSETNIGTFVSILSVARPEYSLPSDRLTEINCLHYPRDVCLGNKTVIQSHYSTTTPHCTRVVLVLLTETLI